MKDLEPLAAGRAVTDYVHGLWRTALFRESDYVRDWVERLARHPVVFATMSDAELETPHFGTFFGLSYHRAYDEPAVSDLYYLHEVVHGALLHYEPEILFSAWYRKMASIEFTASLETEGIVYARVPGLRAASFADEIWADRFLGSEARLGESLFDVMRQDRHKAMRDPDPMDWCEQQIAAYAQQNFRWATVWRMAMRDGDGSSAAYRVVERHMAALRGGAIDLDAHVQWLERQGEIPFREQAESFAKVYWGDKIAYRPRAE